MRIIRKRWNGVPRPAGQRGISLIEVALFIIALGMVSVVGARIYDRHMQTEKIRVTAERTAMGRWLTISMTDKPACRYPSGFQGLVGSGYNEFFRRRNNTVWDEISDRNLTGIFD